MLPSKRHSKRHLKDILKDVQKISTSPGPILDTKGMRAIFRKKDKKRAKKGKIFGNLGKNVQKLKIF